MYLLFSYLFYGCDDQDSCSFRTQSICLQLCWFETCWSHWNYIQHKRYINLEKTYRVLMIHLCLYTDQGCVLCVLIHPTLFLCVRELNVVMYVLSCMISRKPHLLLPTKLTSAVLNWIATEHYWLQHQKRYDSAFLFMDISIVTPFSNILVYVEFGRGRLSVFLTQILGIYFKSMLLRIFVFDPPIISLTIFQMFTYFHAWLVVASRLRRGADKAEIYSYVWIYSFSITFSLYILNFTACF